MAMAVSFAEIVCGCNRQFGRGKSASGRRDGDVCLNVLVSAALSVVAVVLCQCRRRFGGVGDSSGVGSAAVA